MCKKECEHVNQGLDIAEKSRSLLSNIRPVALLGVKGVLTVTDRVKSVVTYAREEIGDLVAEARFEQMTDDLNEDIFDDETK